MERRFSLRASLPYLGVGLGAALAAVLVAALLTNIFERKQEAKNPYLKLVELSEDDVDPKKWGANWPRQYDGYRRTEEASATRYGGGLIGPEGGLPPQKSDKYPWLRRIFAGYLFAVDYRDRRGHAYMLKDQEVTRRNVPEENKQSGNCLHCHASVMPLYRSLGREALPQGSQQEQIFAGLEKVGAMNYWDAHRLLSQTSGGAHPLSCVDCHDPDSMELRVTRPAFIRAVGDLAASSAAVPHLASIERWRAGGRNTRYDPNRDATRQEMRSFVCGQCHVEYFCGKGMTIFFPWAKGLKVEEIESNYADMQVDGKPFRDWVHAETGFAQFKAQHPEFEVWSQGIHARSGVACADCHMPYKREGALKISEHWVRSPLLQVSRSCGACHPGSEQDMLERAYAIQDRHAALLERAGAAAVEAIDAMAALRRERGDGDPRLPELEKLQRAAQWRLDFVAAENSMGFHAPQELARILGESIDMFRKAQVLALQSIR
ncbi:MAG: ammonia-forming cytochrome c nitrite reductase subunit c552 [Myxococcales bacterium]|nr:ammonia-forming cytochrome c nitrite reductase subunit c552 [Myxococcales bacterium]